MKCPNCGNEAQGKYCNECATLLPRKEYSVANEIKEYNSPIKWFLIAAAVLGLIWFLIYDISNPGINKSTNSVSSQEEADKKTYENALSLINNKHYEKALLELNSVTSSTPYYQKANLKIKEILKPLAEERLEEAKKLFAQKQYIYAYAKIQEANGLPNINLPEIKILLPIYEKKNNEQVAMEKKDNVSEKNAVEEKKLVDEQQINSSYSGDSSSNTQETETQYEYNPDAISLNFNDSVILVGVTDEALKEAIKCLGIKDEYGLQDLISSGKIYDVPSNTKALILDRNLTTTKIRILEGSYKGEAGWVIRECTE